MGEFDVRRAIIPIVKLDQSSRVVSLLGTGFFVGSRPAVVTAKHVFNDNPLAAGEAYAMAFVDASGQVGLATIEDFATSDDFDIAVFPASTVPDAITLKLSPKPVQANQDVLTYEYSSTRIEEKDGKLIVKFDPFTHKGNVMRHYTSDFPETVPTPVFDTSFPALQGASGAPVVRSPDFVVVGMLVANYERHLIPAQVVRLEMDDKEIEETRYFLPTGKGIEAFVIVEYLNAIGAEPDIVE